MAKRQTKAEREAADREAYEASRRAALAWPSIPEPTPYSAEKIRELAKAQTDHSPVRAWTFNVYNQAATHGCFTTVSHNNNGARTTSQAHGGPWFETRAEAELALWWAACRRYATELLKLVPTPPSSIPEGGEE